VFKGEVNNRTEEMSSASIIFEGNRETNQAAYGEPQKQRENEAGGSQKRKKMVCKAQGKLSKSFIPSSQVLNISRHCYHMARMKRRLEEHLSIRCHM
jgi:hypothetical protein